MDEAYAELLDKTSGKPLSDALRQDLLSYYVDLDKPFATKQNSKAWQNLIRELDTLKATPATGIPAPAQSSPGTGRVKPLSSANSIQVERRPRDWDWPFSVKLTNPDITHCSPAGGG
jgi:hypothetical protein